MQGELTKIIAQYLSGELSESDRKVFEDRLSTNPQLQTEVAIQQSIMEAVKRSAIRTQVSATAKSFHFGQTIKWTGISIGILVLTAALSFFIYNQVTKTDVIALEEFSEVIEEIKEEGLIENLASEFFTWNGKDTTMLSKNGVLISVPESAFLLNGKKYFNPVLIQFQEALDGTTIIKSGLSTMADDRLLETQGMFSIKAFTQDGKELAINPSTGIYVQVPVDEYKKDMQLFTGEKGKDGIINWTNPKPLAKIPVSVDMKNLNFYPSGYEDSLNQMKLRKDKKYRDSLYLSCEFDIPARPANRIVTNLNQLNTVEVVYDQEATFPGGYKAMLEFISANTLYPPEALDENITGKVFISFVIDQNGEIESPEILSSDDPLFNQEAIRLIYSMPNWIPSRSNGVNVKSRQTIPITYSIDGVINNKKSRNKTNAVSDTVKKRSKNNTNTQSDSINSSPLGDKKYEEAEKNYISPSKVLVFWKPKFNNTNLATREFEKRMQAIHGTCNNKVLEVYTKNLNKPISELDEQVVKMGYSNFTVFAAENVGAVNPDNPHHKALQAFYEKAVKELREDGKRNRDKEVKRREKWDTKVQDARNKENKRTNERNAKNYQEEYDFNYESARKQLDMKKKQLGRTVGTTITAGGIYNLDRFIAEVTSTRKTGEFYDKETGKTARIQYNDFSVEVENAGQYKLLYVYLFPSELNSYQRISGKNGKFDYPLNDGIIYDMAIVGISEKGYSYFQKSKFKEGKLGTVSLDQISEEKLNASIEQLNNNRISKPMQISTELDWLKTEQKNYVEQRNRQNQFLFQERIKKIVFPCYQPASDSVSIEQEEIINIPMN